jgi:cell division protein FtsB
MAKTSIFSKDYEKNMRKRRKRLRIIYVFSLLIVVSMIIKISKYDFNNLEQRLQLWVNKDSNDVEIVTNTEEKQENNTELKDTTNKEEENNNDLKEEKSSEITEEKVAIVINNINLNLVMKNEQGVKKISSIENKPDKYYSTISNNGQNALIIDDMQNIKFIKNNGEIMDLTLTEYIAPNGEVFKKDDVINTYSGYLWHNNAKILGNDKIVYISNIPYFGYDLDQYITIIDLNDKTHETIWNMKGKNISLKDFDGSRLEVTIDGNIRYINENGEETL